MINGQLIAWETECTYNVDKMSVQAFTGENIAYDPKGLVMDDILKLIGTEVDLSFAIGENGTDYDVEPIGKYLLETVTTTSFPNQDETPFYRIELKWPPFKFEENKNDKKVFD